MGDPGTDRTPGVREAGSATVGAAQASESRDHSQRGKWEDDRG